MTQRLDIEPVVLRQWAVRHEQTAKEIREWAEPPRAWLDDFPNSYGPIAHEVHQSLWRFYNARQQAGNNLAAEHDRTAAYLRSAADSYENADRDTATAVGRAGTGAERPGTDAGVGTGGVGSAPIAGAGGRADHAPNAALPRAGAAQTPESGGAPGTSDLPIAAGTHPVTGVPITDAPAAGVPHVLPGLAGAAGASAGRAGGSGPSGPGEHTTPPLSPFLAAVGAARDRDTAPAHILGETVDDDLIMARTLLRSMLAAAEATAVGMSFAVSVMRGPGGIGVFVTSNEGRGWLPPAVFLPIGVSTPWNWAGVLERTAGAAGTPWEGIADPARVLVEFGLAWGVKAGARLTALACSGPLDPRLKAALGPVATAEKVGPAADADLRVLAPDTTDRLGLTGSSEALEYVGTVPPERVRAECVRLVADTHARWGRPRGSTPEAVAAWRLRERILEVVHSDRDVPDQWWEELREADAVLAALALTRRVDVGGVALGEIRPADDPTLCATTFERRCDELVLLLTSDPSPQQLRDIVYAREQLVAHPRFEPLAAAVAVTGTPESRAADVAPGVDGPPRGVSVAPGVTARTPRSS